MENLVFPTKRRTLTAKVVKLKVANPLLLGRFLKPRRYENFLAKFLNINVNTYTTGY
jgi:hypothetical protein